MLKRKNKIALGFIFTFIMLNSLAVWAFSFISLFQLVLLYFINITPIVLILYIVSKNVKQGKKNGGLIFLSIMPFKIVYIFASLVLIKEYMGISTPFLINFLLVYFLLLYLSIFIVSSFLSKK